MTNQRMTNQKMIQRGLKMNSGTSCPNRRRRGFLLVATLAFLAVLFSILLPLVPSALRSRRQVQSDQLRLQGTYLLSSMIQRSLSKLANDSNYSGEQVEVDIEQFDVPFKALAKVTIAEKQLAIHIELRPAEQTANTSPLLTQLTIDRRWKLPEPTPAP